MRKKRLLLILGIPVVLLATLYFGRRWWFESLIVGELRASLEPLLDADLEVGAIRGNWLTEVTVDGVSLRGRTGSAYREIRGLRLTVGFSPWTLLGGDLSGLDRLQVEVEHVSLALEGSFAAVPASADVATTPAPSLGELLAMLPNGATVRVAALELQPAITPVAACTIRLDAGSGTRRAACEVGDIEASASLSPAGEFEATLTAARLGRLLAALDSSIGTTEEGTLNLRLDGTITPLRIGADLAATARLRTGKNVGARVEAQWHNGRLQVAQAIVDLPGVALRASGLDLPLAGVSRAAIAQILQQHSAGSLALSIADLAPYTDLLPAVLASRMPIIGTVALDVERGVVHLRPSRLQGAGIDLRLDAGSFSLLDLSLADLSVAGMRRARLRGITTRLELSEPLQIDLGAGGNLTLQGSITGTVAGSVDAPDIRTVARLQQIRYQQYRCATLAARVQFDGARIVAEELELTGLQRTGDNFAVACGGAVTVHLAAADQPLRIEASAAGELPSGALTLPQIPAFVGKALAPPRYVITADLSIPDDQDLRGSVQLELPELRYAGLEALRLVADGTFVGADVTLRRFDLSGSQGELHATGRVSSETLDLRLEGAVRQLQPLAEVAGLPPLDGQLTLGPTTLEGPLRAPTIDLDLRLAVTAIDPTWFPARSRQHLPGAPLALELRATSGVGGIDLHTLGLHWGDAGHRRIDIESTGSVPLAWTGEGIVAVPQAAPMITQVTIHTTEPLPGQPSVDLTSRIELTDRRVQLPTLKISSTNGSFTATDLRADLPLADLLAGKLDLWTLPVAGRVELLDFKLGGPISTMLSNLVTEVELAGRAAGQLTFSGSLSQPKVDGQVAIASGAIAFGDGPALRDVQLDTVFTAHRASLTTSGRFAGERKLVASAWIDSDQASLWQAIREGNLPVTGRLEIDDFDVAVLPKSLLGMQDLQGIVGLAGSLRGTMGDPVPELEVRVDNGGWRAADLPPVDSLTVRASLTRDQIVLKTCTARFLESPVTVVADIGVVGATLWQLAARPPNATMRGYVTLIDFPLAALPKSLTGSEDLSGSLRAQLEIGGSFREPRPQLDLHLVGGAVKVTDLPRIADLDVKIVADRSGCKVRGTGAMGAAPVTIVADLTPAAGPLAEGWRNAALTATIKGDRLLLMRGSGLKIRGDVDLEATGTLQKIAIGGKVAVVKGSKFIKRLSLVPDLKVRGGAAETAVFGPWVIPGGERLSFDVQLMTQAPMTLRTNVIDTDVDIGCRLLGQGNALHLVGVASSRQGTLRLPGMSMRLHGLRLMFNEANPTRPRVMATASGQRHSIRIQLRVTGPWDDPVVSLSSTPALQPKELWSLVSTGLRPESLSGGTAQSNTTLIATYVIQELLLTYVASESTEEQESFVARFEFEFGSEISHGGQETWQVDLDLGQLWIVPKNYGVRLERDVYEDINLGLVYRWRF